MIKTIIFDFDGTLADSRSLAVRLYNELAYKYGFKEMGGHEVERFSKLSIVERLRVLGVPAFRLPGLVSEMKRNYRYSVDSLQVVEGIPSAIEDMATAGYRLSIISSNLESIIDKFVANHRLNHFEHIYCARNLFGKNYTINRFLRTFHIKKEHVIYVGDELRDIEACKKSGIPICAVAWGYDDANLLAQGKPDYIIQRPSELTSLLRNIRNKDGGE